MTDAGYDEWLDALEDGEGYYLACEQGHGSLPPRRVCPHCGSPELSEEPLPETGTVETFTVVHVPAPDFSDQAPYATVVADFGDVRLTGVVGGDVVDDVEVGTTVEPGATVNPTSENRMVRFRLR
ncbi:hypothetical protein SAMN04487948_102255 [Halogranum amylolyticum]|uniref:ChsH2 C-terminal OB-fold domain-containing protein n=1 Tax=Halogranum amylolyticum TaxID=660520 RepID=A0A1H8PES5_9EURY|nr:OB-fold domain-containing protein [Halogranum amylolyticum]SEO40311.1 hypothetical protein SAMN04487948_102255 [Halogranum amylolyticum]